MAKPVILTIAGSDSGAGAGLQADLRTIHALGGFAKTVVTAVTAQNGRGVRSWKPVEPGLLDDQLASVFEEGGVAAVKSGLLSGRRQLEVLSHHLGAEPFVLDPVLGSTTGTRFLSDRDVTVLKRLLFPKATLVTPNLPEAERLSGVAIRGPRQLAEAAARLLDTGCGAVLIKGGHGKGRLLVDTLFTSEGTKAQWAAMRIRTVNTHGTGCVLSSAIATGLGLGRGLVPAIDEARRLLQLALERGSYEGQDEGRGPAFPGW